MPDSQVRQNKATNQWVIFAPARGKRPHDFVRNGEKRGHLPEYSDDCPFCPGNENQLTSIIMELPGSQGRWQTRVVSNKFPALTPSGDAARFAEGIYLWMPGFGHHEVIVESPEHNRQIASMNQQSAATIVETYHRRYIDILKERHSMMVVIFRNHGPEAGTSLIHPHSQLIALGWAPAYIRWREHTAEQYYDHWGRCVYCDIAHFEMQDMRRLVYENSSFVAFVPYAAEIPFEVWIVPKVHRADFGDISDQEKDDLAAGLRYILAKLHERLNDPDYNYVIHSAGRFKSGEPHLHWYVQIRPRLTTRAGFEIGSGISINPTFPEDDADFLRNSAEASSNG